MPALINLFKSWQNNLPSRRLYITLFQITVLNHDGSESLFDRINDELQEVNLSFNPSFLEIKNKFRKILLDNHKNYSSLHNEWLNKLQFKDP